MGEITMTKNYDNNSFSNPISVRELRKVIGLKQTELAILAGISQVYLSEIENNKKPFTVEAATKIADAVNQLINKESVKIDPELLRAGHIASFLPKDIKTKVNRLIFEIAQKREQLSFYLSDGKELPPIKEANYETPIGEHSYIYEDGTFQLSIHDLVHSYGDQIEENKKKLW